jgi:hypothetical protein
MIVRLGTSKDFAHDKAPGHGILSPERRNRNLPLAMIICSNISKLGNSGKLLKLRIRVLLWRGFWLQAVCRDYIITH